MLVENSREFGGKFTVHTGAIEFVKPEGDRLIELPLAIENDDVERLQKLIKIVYQKIKNLDFPDTETYSKDIKGILEFENDLLDGKV